MNLHGAHKFMNIQEAFKRPQGKFRFISYKPHTKEIIRVSPWSKNLIVSSLDTGVGLLMRRLTGDKTYDLEIDSAEIGTGTNAPADGDTNLQTPVLTGIQRSNQSFTAEQTVLRFFIPDGDLANGSYTEFGLRCGTQLFARAIITPTFTKASAEDTVVEYIINSSN